MTKPKHMHILANVWCTLWQCPSCIILESKHSVLCSNTLRVEDIFNLAITDFGDQILKLYQFLNGGSDIVFVGPCIACEVCRGQLPAFISLLGAYIRQGS